MLLVGTAVLIFTLDPWLGIITLAAVVSIVLGEVRGSWATFAQYEHIQHLLGEVGSVAHESFDGAVTIKALGREDHETHRFATVVARLRDEYVAVGRKFAFYRTINDSLPLVFTVFLLVVGTLRVRSGFLSPGDMVTVAYLFSLSSVPVRLVGYVIWEMASSLAGWERVGEVLDVDRRVTYGSTLAVRESGAADLAGSEVDFSYDGVAPILSAISLDVAPGTTLAVVGPTGSGKTTLTLLLARLWDPMTGRLTLDGRDLRSFARSELAHEVAYVPQQTFLFDDTVAGNITLGADISPDRVAEAARVAGAHEFITALPDGYQTRIGERGATLSGGQQQRMALARALVRRPRLLILDDATSAVDPSIEAEILRRLTKAGLPSTVVLVAYRRASIMLADEVIYLEGGKLVAQGTHDELMERVPGYARLLRAYEEDAARRSA
jgi:ABC-type multidrug transport system fused ATPase/permease subunit